MIEIDTASGLQDLFDRLRTFLTAGALGTATLTLDANAADGDTVTLGQTASNIFTLSSNASAGETVTIDGKVYTFRAALIQDADGGVLIGATAADTVANLVDAINRGAGEGTLWSLGTTYHPTVEAEDNGSGEMLVRAKVPGTDGNSIAVSETCAAGAWDAGTLSEGAELEYTFDATLDDGTAYHVQIGATASDTIDNLVAALNLASGAGTKYSTATPAMHQDVLAAAAAGDTMTVTARRTSPNLDLLALASDLTDGAWDLPFLTGTEAAWVELKYQASPRLLLLRAPGMTGADRIYVGLGAVGDSGTDTYNLFAWMNKTYNPALSFEDQAGYSGRRYSLAWDSSMPYWFIANGQRVMVVNKISTVFGSLYAGAFLPYGTPDEYPQPWIVLGNYNATVRFSSASQLVRGFWDPSTSGCLFLNPSGAWVAGGSWNESGGNEFGASPSPLYIWPFYDGDQQPFTRYRELRDALDGGYNLLPCKLYGNTPATDLFGELDGAYAIPAFAAAAEDTVTIGGVAHLIAQSTFRTTRYYYGALALR